MAVLAVIGGIDSRLRLGGQVAHEEFGEGTVTRITPKGRITVQFSDMRTCRVCPLSQLKPVGAPRVPAVQRGFVLAWALASGLRAVAPESLCHLLTCYVWGEWGSHRLGDQQLAPLSASQGGEAAGFCSAGGGFLTEASSCGECFMIVGDGCVQQPSRLASVTRDREVSTAGPITPCCVTVAFRAQERLHR